MDTNVPQASGEPVQTETLPTAQNVSPPATQPAASDQFDPAQTAQVEAMRASEIAAVQAQMATIQQMLDEAHQHAGVEAVSELERELARLGNQVGQLRGMSRAQIMRRQGERLVREAVQEAHDVEARPEVESEVGSSERELREEVDETRRAQTVGGRITGWVSSLLPKPQARSAPQVTFAERPDAMLGSALQSDAFLRRCPAAASVIAPQQAMLPLPATS